MSSDDHDGTLPPDQEEPKAQPLSAKERAKTWHKEAYQKAKAAHKRRTEEREQSPEGIARKKAVAEFRRNAYLKMKAQRKDEKARDKVELQSSAQVSEKKDLDEKKADLRLLVTTGDKVAPKKRSLHLVKPLEPLDV